MLPDGEWWLLGNDVAPRLFAKQKLIVERMEQDSLMFS